MTIKNITYFLPWFHEGFLAYTDSVNARSRDDEIFVWFCGFVSVAIQQLSFFLDIASTAQVSMESCFPLTELYSPNHYDKVQLSGIFFLCSV